MNVLSVVCARAGSKGLKNKCVVKINHKMVIEYSIEYSLSLGKDVKTVVSTDIEEVINYCENRNIRFIRRDRELCTDGSRIEGTLADAIDRDKDNCKYVSLVYGNIPLRYPKLFHQAIEILKENEDFDAVVSMQNVEKYHPDWMFDYNEGLLPKEKETHYRRQMLPQKMIPDGHTLIFKSEGFYRRFKGMVAYEKDYRFSIFGEKIRPLINSELIIDIDTEKDIILAEKVIQS